MILTNGQEKGLKIAVERYKNKEPYTVICGYAGTGKSTLVQFIIDAIGIDEEDVVYIAYTGKASLVLRNKGCENSMTAHRLLYYAKEKPDRTYEFKPKKKLEFDYKLIVLDECSMLPQEMWELLLSHHVHVIALGDPGQLPPIDGISTILDNPHVMLDEVVRQAQDNPIIRLSMDIRAGKWIDYGGERECRIIPHDKVSDKLLLGADQILCGKNITRHNLNEKMRQIKFGDQYSKEPINGDKIICLHNEWQEIGSTGEPLVNGMIGTVSNISLYNSKLYQPKMIANFTSDNGGMYKDLQMDHKIFVEKESTINKTNWWMYQNIQRAYEFDYGYAITVHKFQGSEAEKVVVFDEWLGDKDYHSKWLYTAATRSSKMLVIVK